MTVHADRIEAFLKDLAIGQEGSDPSGPQVLSEAEYGLDTIVDYLLVSNSLNFVYDDIDTQRRFTTEYDGEIWTGAYALWASMRRALDEGRPITDGEYLRTLTLEETKDIFRGDPPIPMIQARHEILTSMGTTLCDIADGHFHTEVSLDEPLWLFDDGNGLVEWLTSEFPRAYGDERTYSGDTVYFDKKAQLSAGILYGRFADRPGFEIPDLDELTVFADYLIPALLRNVGILEYSPSLARKVDEKRPIAENSPEEVEIRLATVHVGEKLLERVNAGRSEPITAYTLDQLLWLAGRERDLVHHLTETTAY
ncbi:queuosine salvage family protein [Halorubrum sp. CBA1125]|uniref:queuosine salvage family protein n=1 Tax=Halorubrum sp. CBA1125 TaxID=2668072 RepID=UPI0018D2031A|nr:queuosine salvage family protein [Halorubrum sp. CBA1125]